MKKIIFTVFFTLLLITGIVGCEKRGENASTTEEILLQGSSGKSAYDDINAGAAEKQQRAAPAMQP